MGVEVFSTEKRNQCVVRLFTGKKCNKAGYSVFIGINGPYYRCRHHTMELARQRDDVTLDGELLDIAGKYVPKEISWEPFL